MHLLLSPNTWVLVWSTRPYTLETLDSARFALLDMAPGIFDLQ